MKYSYDWLKELSGTKKSPEKITEDLTMRSIEVEKLKIIGKDFNNIIIGKILEIKKHPNADKLQLTKIDIGNKTLDVVCGAHNIKIGDKVSVALIGAKLPGGLKIKEAEIRGEKSFGMLCAKDELGLGTDHDGIFILEEKARIGMPLAKYLKLDDSVIEIKVLPDRAHDCLSHVGIAREIAILENRKYDYDFEGLKLPKKKSKKLSVKVADKKLCPRYIGAVMENVKIKKSPEWMKIRLQTCGIKSINNVVDTTNYIMLELGNPLHAFDYDKLADKNKYANITVRQAKENEKLVLLDESEIALDNSDLLITNSKTPLALAGIMGGKESGISEDTKTIIIEAANFNATNIRKTRMRLNVKTESSDRYEKNIDPNLAEKAMVRVIEILEHTAEAKLEGIVDIYPDKIKPQKVKLNLDYANNLLGENIPKKEVMRILNLLKIKTKANLECEIPTFRIDLKTQEDLVEEIGRIYGYEKIKPEPLNEPVIPPKSVKKVFFERKIKSSLIDFGFNEVYNYSFYSERDAENCLMDKEKHLQLANPMNPDQKYVRIGMLPNILKNIKENLKNYEEVKVFETGNVYKKNNGKIIEKKILSLAQVSNKDKNIETFFKLKGAVENLFESFGVKFNIQHPNECPKILHSTRSAEIKIENNIVGYIGEINPQVLNAYKIKNRVAAVEIDTENFFEFANKIRTYKSISKFPIVVRDISLLAPKNIIMAEILSEIKKAGGTLVKNIELFDIYQKDKENSFAFHIAFSSFERTLNSYEIDSAMKKIILGLEKDLKVKVRK